MSEQQYITYQYLEDEFPRLIPISPMLHEGEMILPRAKPEKTRTMWKCMCEGCGAPLQVRDIQCSYCLRATDHGLR